MTSLLLFVFPLGMAYAAAFDILTMRIPNGVSLGIAAAFLVVAPIAAMPMREMLMHLLVGAAVLIAGMILFSLRFVGGGDAKLLAAASLWIGAEQLLPFLIYVTLFGGVLALLLSGLPADAGGRAAAANMGGTPAQSQRRHAIRARHHRRRPVVYPLTAWPALLAG